MVQRARQSPRLAWRSSLGGAPFSVPGATKPPAPSEKPRLTQCGSCCRTCPPPRHLARFVTGPHMGDESFQRIGKLLLEVKQDKGLHSPASQVPSGASSEANDKC